MVTGHLIDKPTHSPSLHQPMYYNIKLTIIFIL